MDIQLSKVQVQAAKNAEFLKFHARARYNKKSKP